MEDDRYISIQFKNFATGELTDGCYQIPRSTTVEILTKMCNLVLQKVYKTFLIFV